MNSGQKFRLHERLAADTAPVEPLPLCDLRLMDERRYPWLILVPRRESIREIHRLHPDDRVTLMEEIVLTSEAIETLFHSEKINVGALGNLVPQLHIHVIGRLQGDAAWPGPVWGSGPAERYPAAELKETVKRIREFLQSEV
jgi:diadenosine tetraphosphate (Ap4A) HIT family hydrolase